MNNQDKIFIKKFEAQVKNTIERYKLANKKDKILVAISGGKDSTTTLFLLKKFGYKVEALHIDLLMGDWSKKNLKNVKEFCKANDIKLHIFSIRNEIGYSICYVKSVVQQKTKLRQCTICGIIRRSIINKKARELKAKKLATGHNLDDEAQTVIMNWMKGNPSLSINMGPVTGTIRDKKFVTRIKPLYFQKESGIRRYSEIMKFPVLYQRCPCVFSATRHEIRNKLDELEKKNPKIKENIVKNFLVIQKKLRKHEKKGKLIYCEICGEPSRNKICNSCKIMGNIKK